MAVYASGSKQTVCKTVVSDFLGSNPSAATPGLDRDFNDEVYWKCSRVILTVEGDSIEAVKLCPREFVSVVEWYTRCVEDMLC